MKKNRLKSESKHLILKWTQV